MEAAAGFFFTSALAASTVEPGFRFLEGFSRLLSKVCIVASPSFFVASAPARFSVPLVGTSKEGLLGVNLDPGRDTERVLEVSLPGALGVLKGVLLLVCSAPVLL